MNDYVVAVFRSRTQVLNFKNILNNNNIDCEIISTPREIAVGCGLSLKIGFKDLEVVKKIYYTAQPASFVGIYIVNFDGYKAIIKAREV